VAVQPHLRSKSRRARNGQRQATVESRWEKLPFPLAGGSGVNDSITGAAIPSEATAIRKKEGPQPGEQAGPTSWAA
jgi:hypothetical protein